jgi:hypothetical protein
MRLTARALGRAADERRRAVLATFVRTPAAIRETFREADSAPADSGLVLAPPADPLPGDPLPAGSATAGGPGEPPLEAQPSPAADTVSEAPPPPPPAQPPSLVLINPPSNGGEVHFLVDGRVVTLRPGESRQLAGGPTWRVHFHRGAHFGEALHVVSQGSYSFRVSARGWELLPGNPAR